MQYYGNADNIFKIKMKFQNDKLEICEKSNIIVCLSPFYKSI